MDHTKEELRAMKRADLQKLCKKFGIKANMKTEKLVEGLEELIKYSNTTNLENQENNLPECPSNEAIANEPVNAVEEAKNDAKEPENKSETNKLTTLPAKKKSGSKTKKPPVKAASKIPKRNAKSDPKNMDCKTPTTNANGKSKTPKLNKPKDWSKIHQKQFDKMDSLDVYLSKKRKRAEDLGTRATKRAKVLTEKPNTKTEKPNTKTKVIRRQKLAPKKSVHAAKSKKSTVVTPKPKKETLNTTKRLTFNFLPSAKENAVQTPGTGKRRATLNDVLHKPATPFRFTSNTMPFGSPTPRQMFDLQASLAKPLRYKPYTGKLPTPPCAKHSPKVAVKKTSAAKSHQRDVKAVKTKTHNERRERQLKTQRRARESAVSRRRGLMI